MPKPFDAASKNMVALAPSVWTGIGAVKPKGPVSFVNPDVSAVTAAADSALLVNDEVEPWVAHLEFVADRQHDRLVGQFADDVRTAALL